MRHFLPLLWIVAVLCCPGCQVNEPQDLQSAVKEQHASAPGKAAAPNYPATSKSAPSGAVLLRPAQLAAKLPPLVRRSSYVVADLSKAGKLFEAGLPHQNAVAGNNDCAFDASFGEPGSPGSSGLAFATYRFTIPDYDGNSQLSLEWTNAPAVPEESYIGLANWGQDRWDWFIGNAAGVIEPPSLAPYFLPDGTLLVNVLLSQQNSAELNILRIGSQAPLPVLSATPKAGPLPLTVQFSAAASTDPDGSITEYRWDPEGDGSFDVSTGTDPTFSQEYVAAGTVNAAVRVVDSSGIHAEASVALKPFTSNYFSFGSGANEERAKAVVPCDDGSLFCAGYRDGGVGGQNVLVTRLGLDGEAQFVRTWGGSKDDVLVDAVKGPDGAIYAVGQTDSLGAGLTDGLLQKWSQDGELLWSRTYGGSDDKERFKSILVTADAIYIAGEYAVFGVGTLAIEARLDLNGNPVWVTSVISAGACGFTDLAISKQAFDDPVLLTCGYFEDAGLDRDALYTVYSLDGNASLMLTLGGASTVESCNAIGIASQSLLQKPFVLGTITDGSSQDAFVSAPNGTAARISLEAAGDISGVDLLGVGNSLSALFAWDGGSGLDQTAVATMSTSLVLSGTLGSFGTSVDQNDCNRLLRYNTDTYVVTGLQRGTAPAVTAIPLSSTVLALSWQSISPPQGSPSTLVAADTNLDVTLVTGMGLDRGELDGDVFVLVDKPVPVT